jgi:hypothetical protein
LREYDSFIQIRAHPNAPLDPADSAVRERTIWSGRGPSARHRGEIGYARARIASDVRHWLCARDLPSTATHHRPLLAPKPAAGMQENI